MDKKVENMTCEESTEKMEEKGKDYKSCTSHPATAKIEGGLIDPLLGPYKRKSHKIAYMGIGGPGSTRMGVGAIGKSFKGFGSHGNDMMDARQTVWRQEFIDLQKDMADVVTSCCKIMEKCANNMRKLDQAYEDKMQEIQNEGTEVAEEGYEAAYRIISDLRDQLEEKEEKDA